MGIYVSLGQQSALILALDLALIALFVDKVQSGSLKDYGGRAGVLSQRLEGVAPAEIVRQMFVAPPWERHSHSFGRL
jgi:hypothetical protein